MQQTNNILDTIFHHVLNYENKYDLRRRDYCRLASVNGIKKQIISQLNNKVIYVNYLREIFLYNKKLWEIREVEIDIETIKNCLFFKDEKNEWNITT